LLETKARSRADASEALMITKTNMDRRSKR
jgi:hypothetical protein